VPDHPALTAPLDHLPGPGDRRIAVRVTADALRQIRGGSPWLYEGSITSAGVTEEHPGEPGDLAVVFDDKRKFVAIGLWDPASPIRVKLLHHGDPRQIDDDWWRSRIAAALDARSGLDADPDTTAFRCIHGENDGFPGLVVDRYDRTLVVKLYSPIWFPHLRNVVPLLAAGLVDDSGPERLVLRLSRAVQRTATFGLTDGATLVGEPPDGPVLFRERGLTMEADVVHGHKTGHFLDQRDNRALVRSMSDGARVLDVFASTGGFSLSAAAGGAALVHLVDISEPALRAAERNVAHNRHIRSVRNCAFRSTTGDAFAVMKELHRREEQYDVVILDPPSFAQNAKSVPAALRAYYRLTQAGVALVRPGGVLVQASCSSRVDTEEFFTVVHDAASRAGVELHEIRRTGHPVDHPIGFEHGAYLKAVFARVDR
jgi:23S rRNA (cytosine1962-C5)-methyltransferase